MRKIALACLFLMSQVAFSNAVSLSGAVYDQLLNPLQGVVVSVKNLGLSDTSKIDGAWSINQTSNGISDELSSFSYKFKDGKITLVSSVNSMISLFRISVTGKVKWHRKVQIHEGVNEFVVGERDDISSDVIFAEMSGKKIVFKQAQSERFNSVSASY